MGDTSVPCAIYCSLFTISWALTLRSLSLVVSRVRPFIAHIHGLPENIMESHAILIFFSREENNDKEFYLQIYQPDILLMFLVLVIFRLCVLFFICIVHSYAGENNSFESQISTTENEYTQQHNPYMDVLAWNKEPEKKQFYLKA